MRLCPPDKCINIAADRRALPGIPESSTARLVRAHPCAAGAPTLKRHGSSTTQALGRIITSAWFSTKIHVSCATAYAANLNLRFILDSERQQHDISPRTWIDRRLCWRARTGIDHTGYDAQEFRQHILELGMMPVIPPRSEPQGTRRLCTGICTGERQTGDEWLHPTKIKLTQCAGHIDPVKATADRCCHRHGVRELHSNGCNWRC